MEPEGRADNHAHREINRVSFDREFFEFLPHNAPKPIHTTMFTSFLGITTTLRIVLLPLSAN